MARRITPKQKYPTAAVPENEGRQIAIKHQIKPKTQAQAKYIEQLRNLPMNVGAGPAGSGKTWLACYVALEKLFDGEVDKIVLTRPVRESGESLGYLPGTLEEKLDPYLKPLMEAIEDHVGVAGAKRLLETGKLKIEPLAFMRGRTFNNAFMLLDEAQNSTIDQMKMFVTRAGENTQISINGDITQSDLEAPRDAGPGWCNGLQFIINKTAGRDKKIGYAEFKGRDVVRSEMVKKLVYLMDSDATADIHAFPSVIDGAETAAAE